MNKYEQEEIRCINCSRLLAKAEGNGFIEIKCPRCKELNLYHLMEKTNKGRLDFTGELKQGEESKQMNS